MKLCGVVVSSPVLAGLALVFVCLALLPVFKTEEDDSPVKPMERFSCGVDICNVGEQDQYCDQRYRRCHDCSFKQNECYLQTMPSNCSRFCIGIGVKLALLNIKEKPCKPLNMVVHGNHNVSRDMEQTVDTVVKTYCDVGYTLKGVDTTQCMEFGVWSYPLPVCKEITCPKPPTLLNGAFTAKANPDENSVFLFNSTIYFVCHDGHTLYGDNSWHCQENGHWDVNISPQCSKDEDSILVVVLTVVSSCCIGVSCSLNVIQFCFAISNRRKYKAYVTVDPTDKDKVDVTVGPTNKDKVDVTVGPTDKDKVDVTVGPTSKDKVDVIVGLTDKDKVDVTVGPTNKDKVDVTVGPTDKDKVDVTVGPTNKDKVDVTVGPTDKDNVDVTVGPINKDKVDVGINTEPQLDFKLNESEIQTNCSVMEVDETTLTASSPNLQAAPLLPREQQELVPSASSENDNIKSGPRGQENIQLPEITTIGKKGLPVAPNTLDVPSNSGDASSLLHPDGSNVTQGQGLTFHAGCNVVINTGDNNTISGQIGDNSVRKTVTRRIRRNSSNSAKDKKDEADGSHPTEKSDETKLIKSVQPVDQDENNVTKTLLPQTVSINGHDDDSDDEVDNCPKISLLNSNGMANQLKKPCVRE